MKNLPVADTSTVGTLDFEMEKGSISNGRIAGRVPRNMRFLEGMTIDAEGMLWIALWGDGQVCLVSVNDPINTTTPQCQLNHYTQKAVECSGYLLSVGDFKANTLYLSQSSWCKYWVSA